MAFDPTTFSKMDVRRIEQILYKGGEMPPPNKSTKQPHPMYPEVEQFLTSSQAQYWSMVLWDQVVEILSDTCIDSNKRIQSVPGAIKSEAISRIAKGTGYLRTEMIQNVFGTDYCPCCVYCDQDDASIVRQCSACPGLSLWGDYLDKKGACENPASPYERFKTAINKSASLPNIREAIKQAVAIAIGFRHLYYGVTVQTQKTLKDTLEGMKVDKVAPDDKHLLIMKEGIEIKMKFIADKRNKYQRVSDLVVHDENLLSQLKEYIRLTQNHHDDLYDLYGDVKKLLAGESIDM